MIATTSIYSYSSYINKQVLIASMTTSIEVEKYEVLETIGMQLNTRPNIDPY